MTGARLAFDLPTRRATIRLAQRLAPELRGGDLVVLQGPLGSGKTFFTRALCRALGLPREHRVTSPTFILVRELETAPPLAHADVYRLSGEEDVKGLGLGSRRVEGWLVVVEWGGPYIEALGGDGLRVDLEVDPRRAELSATGPRSQKIVNRLAEC